MTRTEKFRFLSLLLLGAGGFSTAGAIIASVPHLRGGVLLLTVIAIALFTGHEWLQVSEEAKEHRRALTDGEKRRIHVVWVSLVAIVIVGIWSEIGAG